MTTPAQYTVYTFIKNFIADKGYSPSFAEIALGVGLRSKSLIHRHVHALAEAGLLQIKPGKRRQITLNSSERVAFPILGKIAAGAPIEAIPIGETLDIIELLASIHHDGRFALKVKGNSMQDEGILDGDMILCESRQTARNGDIVIALVDHQEATLKRIYYNTDRTITLAPANAAFQPMIYAADRISIQGIFIGLLRISLR